MKDSWDKVFGHSYESCKSPRQIESENEMIVISHRLFFLFNESDLFADTFDFFSFSLVVFHFHFFTAPFYFAFIWFRVQGSRFRVQGSGFRALVAASPPFLEDGILVSQPSPLGNAIKLSGRTFLAPHRGSCPKGLCKRTGFLGVKRRENPVRRHFERSEMRGLRSGIA